MAEITEAQARRWHGKRVPHFWWDFAQPATCPVIVESDDPRHSLVARFECEFGSPSCEIAIKAALKLIEDLEAGRKDYRRLARAAAEGGSRDDA